MYRSMGVTRTPPKLTAVHLPPPSADELMYRMAAQTECPAFHQGPCLDPTWAKTIIQCVAGTAPPPGVTRNTWTKFCARARVCGTANKPACGPSAAPPRAAPPPSAAPPPAFTSPENTFLKAYGGYSCDALFPRDCLDERWQGYVAECSHNASPPDGVELGTWRSFCSKVLSCPGHTRGPCAPVPEPPPPGSPEDIFQAPPPTSDAPPLAAASGSHTTTYLLWGLLGLAGLGAVVFIAKKRSS